MDRIAELRSLIDLLDSKYPNDDYIKYIGTGNPNANILIIGKEASIGSEKTNQVNNEIVNNFKNWKEMIDYNQKNVPNYFDYNTFNPLYPYKGQKFKINNEENRGTSRTWHTYQKLINNIFNLPRTEEINFHEYTFLTEVNPYPSKKTKDADKSLNNQRKEDVLKSGFFQSFPVVIISGVGYFSINENYNEIEKIFNVKYDHGELAEKNTSQPFWIHTSTGLKPKIVINTHQLSIGISDMLLKEVADYIRNNHLLLLGI